MGATSAGIYVRISQDRTGLGLGVDRQEEDCRKLAASLGWSVHKLYRDNDMSAYSGKPRPEYQTMLDDLRAGRINAVIAQHPDRLHRSAVELETYIEIVEAKKVATQTVQAGMWDLSTPSGRAVARTLGAWARYESEHKGERIRRARVQQAKAGGWHGGMRPYGYESDGMTVRHAEAAEIVNAAEQVLAGVSLRQLVRDLNSRGVSTATARGPWTSVALRDILLRPRTAGLSSHLGVIVGTAQWPALIPEDTWRAVGAILSNPARRTNDRGGTVQWLGSGIYLCGVCLEPKLRVGSTSTNRRTYRCGNRENEMTTGHVTREAYTLDDLVETAVVARLSREDARDVFQRDPESLVDRGALEREKLGVDARLSEFAVLRAQDKISARVFADAAEELGQQAARVDAALSDSLVQGPLASLAGVEDVFRAWFGVAEDRSDGFPLGKRRAILTKVVTVTVLPANRGPRFDPDRIKFDWKI